MKSVAKAVSIAACILSLASCDSSTKTEKDAVLTKDTTSIVETNDEGVTTEAVDSTKKDSVIKE